MADYIGVVGAAFCDRETADLAYRVGRALAREGLIVVCGGMGGVMESVARGVSEEKGVVIGILPGRDRLEGNRYLTYAIPTGLGDARNAVIACAADALIAIAGGFGTLSEISLARKAGKPVVGLKTWKATNGTGEDLGVVNAATPEEAVAKILDLLEDKRRRDNTA
ncbi:MAG TPA: TIGR00725 family protein [Syntrophothermus lipocalidus]|nr:TIGR00725 family protein [Syntrophothermus lipocalidus]